MTRKQRTPELCMASYKAEEVLGRGRYLPLWISYGEPLVELPYEWVRGPESLRLKEHMLVEWPDTCRMFWQKLEEIGVERIAGELREISKAHGGKSLALVDYEDVVTNGDRSHRLVFSAWWEEKTGEPVLELAGDGSKLHLKDLPKRTRVKRPKPPEEDRRYREQPPLPHPLTHEDVARWIQGRYWQQARTRTNPHSYTLRHWGETENFERVILYIRQHGYLQQFGGDTYVQLDVGDHFFWSMGELLDATVVLNRKVLERENESEWQAEDRTREQGREPALFGTRGAMERSSIMGEGTEPMRRSSKAAKVEQARRRGVGA